MQKTSLPERIKKCVELIGNGDEAARVTGIPRRTLETYLAGRAEIKAERLAAFCEAANVSGHWLLTGEGEMIANAAQSAVIVGNVDVARRISQLRVMLSLSQSDFAGKIGTTKAGLQAIESGATFPSGNLFLEFQKLGANINWLLSGEGSMFRNAGESPATTLSVEELLESSIRLVNMALSANRIAIDSDRQSTLTMLVYEAQKEGKKGTALTLFVDRLSALVASHIAPDPVSEPLLPEEKELLDAFRSATPSKKVLMLGHVPKLSKAA